MRTLVVHIVTLLALASAPVASALEFEEQYHLTRSVAQATAIGDVTGDGRNDALLTTWSNSFFPQDDWKLTVFAQQPDGSLARTRLDTHASFGDQMGISVGDVTGDGRPDAAVATVAGVDLFVQQPGGGLGPAQLIANSPPQAAHVVIADVDGDALNDLVVSSVDRTGFGEDAETTPGEGIVLLRSDGEGGFVRSSVSPSSVHEIEVADLNGDGRLDVAAVIQSTLTNADSSLRIFEQQTDGSFAATPPIGPLGWIAGLGVGDVTGDGRADAVVSRTGMAPESRILVFPQLADGTVRPEPAAYATNSVPEPVEVADLNRDGRRDVVTFHGGWQSMGVYLQQPGGGLADEKLIPASSVSHYNLKGVSVGDLDSDRFPDVAVGSYDNGLIVMRQIPPPNHAPDCAGASVAPATLLPVTNRMRRVTTSVSDPDGDPVQVTVTAVRQDEPVTSRADRTAPDAALTSAEDVVQLRVERSQRGDGRVYRLAFTAADDRGAQCQGMVTASVPRHKKVAAVDSAPPDYDSLAGP